MKAYMVVNKTFKKSYGDPFYAGLQFTHDDMVSQHLSDSGYSSWEEARQKGDKVVGVEIKIIEETDGQSENRKTLEDIAAKLRAIASHLRELELPSQIPGFVGGYNSPAYNRTLRAQRLDEQANYVEAIFEDYDQKTAKG